MCIPFIIFKNFFKKNINRDKQPLKFNINEQVLNQSHPISQAAYGETAMSFEIYSGAYIIQERICENTYIISNQVFGPYQTTELKPHI